jgi:hypothetical protein
MGPLLVVLAVSVGVAIAYVDSRPTWDDTGITAVAITVMSFHFAALSPVRPWLWALAVGLWVPTLGIATGNYGSTVALVFAFVGAYAGALARRSAQFGASSQV